MSEPMEEDLPLATPQAEVHSITAREPIRTRLAADVEAFLARGGSIQEVPRDYRADPPKRPDTTYGRSSL